MGEARPGGVTQKKGGVIKGTEGGKTKNWDEGDSRYKERNEGQVHAASEGGRQLETLERDLWSK